MRMTDEQAATVGAWIADARQRLHNWRQEDLASRSRLSRSRLSAVENGQQGPKGWNLTTFAAIEDALRVPRGTLRRVADGEPIRPDQVHLREDKGQVVDQIRRLADLVERLEQRVEQLESRDD